MGRQVKSGRGRQGAKPRMPQCGPAAQDVGTPRTPSMAALRGPRPPPTLSPPPTCSSMASRSRSSARLRFSVTCGVSACTAACTDASLCHTAPAGVWGRACGPHGGCQQGSVQRRQALQGARRGLSPRASPAQAAPRYPTPRTLHGPGPPPAPAPVLRSSGKPPSRAAARLPQRSSSSSTSAAASARASPSSPPPPASSRRQPRPKRPRKTSSVCCRPGSEAIVSSRNALTFCGAGKSRWVSVGGWRQEGRGQAGARAWRAAASQRRLATSLHPQRAAAGRQGGGGGGSRARRRGAGPAQTPAAGSRTR